MNNPKTWLGKGLTFMSISPYTEHKYLHMEALMYLGRLES